jgi:predicted TIM-barrel fold metal-dependent hydrolase
MIIDGHNHPDWHSHDLQASLDNMDQYGIDKAWLLTCEFTPSEYPPEGLPYGSPRYGIDKAIPFANCLSYMERAGDRFVLGYAPDPRLPESIDQLEAAIEIHHVKVYGEFKYRVMCDDLDCLRMFRFCGEKKLPVVVHLDYEFDTGVKYPRRNWWYGGGIEPFERAIRACPETNFLGHAPGFWSHISGDDLFDKDPYPAAFPVLPGGKIISMLRQYPNLYCDISADSGRTALSRDLAFTKDFLLEFQDRIVYARDFFDNAHQELLNSLGLPNDALAKIYSGNALKLAPL